MDVWLLTYLWFSCLSTPMQILPWWTNLCGRFHGSKKNDTFKAEYSKNLYTCFRVFNCCFRCPVPGLYITTPFKLHDVSSISNDHFPSIKSLQDTLKIPTRLLMPSTQCVAHIPRVIHRNGTNWHIRMNVFLQCEGENHVSNFSPEAQNKEEEAFVSARHTYSYEVSVCSHWHKMN